MPTRPLLLAYLPPFLQNPAMLNFTGASPAASQETVFIPGSHFLTDCVISPGVVAAPTALALSRPC